MLVDTWLWREHLTLRNQAVAWVLCRIQLRLGELETGRTRGAAGVAMFSRVWGDQLYFGVCFILFLRFCCWSQGGDFVNWPQRRGRQPHREKNVQGSYVEGEEGDVWAGLVSPETGTGWAPTVEVSPAPSLLDSQDVATALKSQVVPNWAAVFIIECV